MSKSKKALDDLIAQEYSAVAAARTPNPNARRQAPQRGFKRVIVPPAAPAPPRPVRSRQELFETLGPLAEEMGLKVTSITGGKEKRNANRDRSH